MKQNSRAGKGNGSRVRLRDGRERGRGGFVRKINFKKELWKWREDGKASQSKIK